eukprot:12225277-Alexandrium_andersonii.AAC.1
MARKMPRASGNGSGDWAPRRALARPAARGLARGRPRWRSLSGSRHPPGRRTCRSRAGARANARWAFFVDGAVDRPNDRSWGVARAAAWAKGDMPQTSALARDFYHDALC